MWSHRGNTALTMSHPAPNQDFAGCEDANGAVFVLVQEAAGPKLLMKL